MNDLGNVLMIVNPVAQSGKGNRAGSAVFNFLREKYNQDTSMIYTQHTGHATDIAKQASHFDTVLAVGGDGLVHECMSGIVQIEKENRPNFAVIPVGSGNDYARSLNISSKTEEAIDQIMTKASALPVDIGKVNDKVYVETLSLGLDAAIAIGSEELRKKNQRSGKILYFESGVNEIVNNFNNVKFTAVLDPGTDHSKTIEGDSVLLAIQIGPTYGGGFPITPDAKIDDGIFNLCYTEGRVTRKKALAVYSLASQGKHTGFKCMKFDTAHEIELNVEGNVACQMDGERYEASDFHIVSLDKAVKVYRIP